MGRKRVICLLLGLLAAAVIVAFPVKTTRTVSGWGEVLTREKEKVGECTLSIEISEVKSLCFCYRKRFTYSLDGKDYTSFASSSYAEADGLCLISQMYYDEQKDAMDLCSLVFPEDFSYAVICSNANLYLIKKSVA